ncbi:phosphoribosylamine--glycine ligase [Clostridium aminobutyricum]|uniref:Phosphoribosylamine--glycine ligase n=1 Tax=Clostridium aminobutyricum TaxID=33953 RepID=A0A939D8H9_CLOAM|nr:phosphoribosylamine--glycine ligase [Clostridium aminobutyricum]MBN7773045.1 phosphoribosylamine--glycine ligase [Clostridium aminobutyricum]
MKVLIVGGGGREHAIAWKLAQSPNVDKIYCAPGNAGIANVAECIAVKAEDIKGICRLAAEKEIDLAVIGPEVPLALGIVDELEDIGVRTFGPNKKCAQLEASKAFTKAFLARHNIPTAGYKEFTDKNELLEEVGLYGYPMVIKADGLAAGKGVVIAETKEDAVHAIEEMMGERVFGDAGDKIVVEEYLTGVEASMLCFVDEHTIVPMESAQDYKRIFDGDKGPNTGGMGTYSPSLVFNKELEERIRTEILEPTLAGFQKDGLDFRGVLFVGLMISENGPKVIEFNNRFGDPETQSVLLRLETDLYEIFDAVVDNRLADINIQWSDKKAVCVVLASGGYPGDYERGKVITGLEEVDEDAVVFHAGTKALNTSKLAGDSGCGIERVETVDIVTDGGRVLGVAVLGNTHDEARMKAFENVKRIHFEGLQYRNDIGLILKK